MSRGNFYALLKDIRACRFTYLLCKTQHTLAIIFNLSLTNGEPSISFSTCFFQENFFVDKILNSFYHCSLFFYMCKNGQGKKEKYRLYIEIVLEFVSQISLRTKIFLFFCTFNLSNFLLIFFTCSLRCVRSILRVNLTRTFILFERQLSHQVCHDSFVISWIGNYIVCERRARKVFYHPARA